MDLAEKKIIENLDSALEKHNVKQSINAIVQKVEEVLERDPKALMAWEPIPLGLYGRLPNDVKSSWVFILRKNTITGAERHPNSIQRMMSYRGRGDFQTKLDSKWDSNFLESNSGGQLENRWISIPVNVWHQGAVGDENWVVISFHTVEVSELIEERPDESDETKFHAEKYINKV